MEAHNHHVAVPCRCGGQAKVFGPCTYAPTSHWGIYCSRDKCDRMAVADSLDEAIINWNEELALEAFAL